MQKKYESPEMDVIELEDRDVIVRLSFLALVTPMLIRAATAAGSPFGVMPYRTRAC